MKIIVRQKYGLGNQLFRYAAARCFAARLGATVENAIHMDRPVSERDRGRPFLLNKFRISTPAYPVTEFGRFIQSNRKPLKQIAAAVRKQGRIVLLDEPKEFHLNPLPAWDVAPKTIYMRGFWQVAAYVEEIWPSLKDEMQFRDPPSSAQNQAMLDCIVQADNAVAIHVRRGDYLKPETPTRPLEPAYYHNAVAGLRQRLDRPVFFVFSDDAAYARGLFPDDDAFTFVTHNDDDTSYEDIRLMAACRHHVIANSSFSWWGAWLGKGPDKIVICPRDWFARPGSWFPDIFPASWTPIQSVF